MLRAGQAEQAYRSLQGQAASIVALGDIELTINVIELFACLFAQRAEQTPAARLAGSADALREQAEMPRTGPDAELLEFSLAGVRDSVGAESWREQHTAGPRLSAEDALTEAGA
jgi:hypothetical protein